MAIKGKEWLQEELAKLVKTKSFSRSSFESGDYPVRANYNVQEVDALVAQLGEPVDTNEQITLLKENAE